MALIPIRTVETGLYIVESILWGLMDTTYRVPLLDSKLVRLRYAWYYHIKSPSGPSSALTVLGTPQPSFWTLNAVEPCLTYPNLYLVYYYCVQLGYGHTFEKEKEKANTFHEYF